MVDPVDKLDLTSLGVELSWELDTLFTTPLRYDKSNRAVEMAEKNVTRIEDDLRAEILRLHQTYRDNYNLWLLSSISIKLKNAYLKNRLESFGKSTDKATALSDLERARAEHYSAVKERIQSKTMLLSSWAELLRATGELNVENFFLVVAE